MNYIFAINLAEAEKFKIRLNSIGKHSSIICNHLSIKGIRDDTIFLVGDYRENPNWPELRLELEIRKDISRLEIIEERGNDN